MDGRLPDCHKVDLIKAANLLVRAMAILDELEALGKITSHLDLAVARLQKLLGPDGRPGVGEQLASQLEAEWPRPDTEVVLAPNPWDNA